MSAQAGDQVLDLDRFIPFPRPEEGHGLGQPPFRDEALGAWVISSYQDVDRILRDHQTFSSKNVLGPERAKAASRFAADAEKDPRASVAMIYFRSTRDGEAHRRERSFFNTAFTPGRVKRYEPAIVALCTQLTDAIVGRSDVEFVGEFAVPLSVQVIAHTLGMPREHFGDFKRWSDGFEGLTTLESTPDHVEAFLAAADEFTAYMTPLIESRRAEPAGDIISDVAAVNEKGDQLTVEETLRTIAGLMLAGNETTTGALAGTMMYLVRKPDLQAEVRADPALIDALVEEGLRLSTPAQALFRTATTVAEIGGVEIAAGERVYVRFAAANRDEGRFDEPLCPHLGRTDKRHLAFGRGVHVCPGAPLARAELRIALEMLLARTSLISLNARSDAVTPTGGEMTTRVGALHLDIRC